MSRTRATWVVIASAVVAVCAAAYIFRNPIANAVVDYALAHSDERHCTKPHIDIAAALDRIDVSEMECTMRSGPVRYVHTEGLTRIRFSGLSQVHVHIDKATIDQRDRDVSNVETNTLGEVADLVGAMDSFSKGMLDAAEMYSPSLPSVEIDEVTMKRAGKMDSVMYGFSQSLDGRWNRSQAKRVEMPGGGNGLVSVQALDMRVTPQQGRMTASIFITKPSPGEQPDVTLEVQGRKLDAKRPHISIEI